MFEVFCCCSVYVLVCFGIDVFGIDSWLLYQVSDMFGCVLFHLCCLVLFGIGLHCPGLFRPVMFWW